MKFKDLQKNWDHFGRTDPMWAIYSFEDKKGGKWDINEFFALGEKEIADVMKYVESLGIKISRKKALDFGCGIGRLTQPLAHYFDEVYGVDIAPSMIELAKKHNRHHDKVKYYLNQRDDLKLFSDNSFDFIYTTITLQHMEPRYSRSYIKEFLRILAPHGILIFQLPSTLKIINKSTGTVNLGSLILRIIPKSLWGIYYKARWVNQPRIELYGIKQEDVVRFLEENGAKIIDLIQGQNAVKGWVSFRYCVTKK